MVPYKNTNIAYYFAADSAPRCITPLGVEDNREKTEKQKKYRITNKECRISKGSFQMIIDEG
jgi:hypothetical protein